MFPNEIIASKRKLIGYADFDIATKIGLNLSWYSDLEQYTDEILDNVNFTFVLKTLKILDLRASETFIKHI